MWKPRPGKWLFWALPMVALPTFAAFWLNTGTLVRDISARSTERLFAIGANWAVTTFDGRDASLGGDAPSQEAIDKALDALSGVYGVRTVTNGARIVAPVPVTLVPSLAPAITPVAIGIQWPFTLNETWVEDGAVHLLLGEPVLVQTPAPAHDCAGAMAELSAAFPIRFAFNGTQVNPPLDADMNQYAALLKDPRCATLKAGIAGHADFWGPKLSNQALSEARPIRG